MSSHRIASEERGRLRRLGLLTCVLSGVGGTLAAYATHPVLPFSPLRLPYADKVNPSIWMPEGWAFFTRDAREEDTRMFLREGGQWRNASEAPHFRPENLFGLDRTSKGQGVELGLLVQKVSSESRRECKEAPIICLERAPAALTIENTAPRPTLCGQVGLVFQKPVPWAWSRAARPVVMPSRILRLEVKC